MMKKSFPISSCPFQNPFHHYSFTQSAFTLIELLVITAQHCRDFISNACIVSLQNTPLFLKAKGSARGKENFFLVKKSCLFPAHHTPLLS